MAGGTGALLPAGSLLAREEFLVVADLDGVGSEARIFLAAPVTLSDLETVHGDRIEEREEIVWAEKDGAVISRRMRVLDQIILEQHHVPAEGEKLRPVFLEGIRLMGLSVLPWKRDAQALRDRSEWYRQSGCAPAGWPDLSENGLYQALSDWLGIFVEGMTRREHLARLDLAEALRAYLGPRYLQELERMAPTSVTVPSGSRIRLDYANGATPVLAVKLQELFGLTATPAIAGGRVSLLIHLLSPASRPLAVTKDLASFWRNAYPQVRREMRGRYPKHPWPEDPLTAHPTGRPKKKNV
jgi:ATP-dependent helicase HrpB